MAAICRCVQRAGIPSSSRVDICACIQQSLNYVVEAGVRRRLQCMAEDAATGVDVGS